MVANPLNQPHHVATFTNDFTSDITLVQYPAQ